MRHHTVLDVTASARTFENPRVQTHGAFSQHRERDPHPDDPTTKTRTEMRMARVLRINMRTFLDQPLIGIQ